MKSWKKRIGRKAAAGVILLCGPAKSKKWHKDYFFDLKWWNGSKWKERDMVPFHIIGPPSGGGEKMRGFKENKGEKADAGRWDGRITLLVWQLCVSRHLANELPRLKHFLKNVNNILSDTLIKSRRFRRGHAFRTKEYKKALADEVGGLNFYSGPRFFSGCGFWRGNWHSTRRSSVPRSIIRSLRMEATSFNLSVVEEFLCRPIVSIERWSHDDNLFMGKSISTENTEKSDISV